MLDKLLALPIEKHLVMNLATSLLEVSNVLFAVEKMSKK